MTLFMTFMLVLPLIGSPENSPCNRVLHDFASAEIRTGDTIRVRTISGQVVTGIIIELARKPKNSEDGWPDRIATIELETKKYYINLDKRKMAHESLDAALWQSP